ncbi:TetR/AcrR family transcriptional regulator [Pararhodobacter sp.]|uniref:TetR/AcrR family transcriptional regulator n=1 Tax=Pararhodobacter sp. TaxID=2127056 RepID=UPI002AFFD485|nr:TetR/AcrR family transcriptional regulator [Pararhodobacter sp.]
MTEPLFDPENARDRLLAAAAKLFHRKGFAATTVREIGAEVGILSGSLFHHVRSKDDILFAVMDRVINAMTRDLAAALHSAPDLISQVRALISVELSYLHGPNRDATAVLFHDWRALPVDRRAILLEGRNAYFQLWQQVLTEARDHGLTAVDPAILRQFLHGALAWTSFWYRPDHTPPAAMPLEALIDQAIAMILPPDQGGAKGGR